MDRFSIFRRWRKLPAAGGVLLLAAMTFAVYVPVLGGGFIWDDDKYVVENPHLGSADGLRRIWLTTESEQYYPLVFTSFWLEHRVYGLNAAGYHAVNVALHALNAALVWRLLRRLGVPEAWLAGALFAVHPINTESVAWVTERKNVLSGAFYLLAFACYLRFDDGRAGRPPRRRPEGPIEPPRRGRRWYAGALFLFVAALLSKTVTCTLPVALLLVRWYRGRPLRARDLLQVVPFVALGLAGGLVTSWYEGVRMKVHDVHVIESFAGRFIIAARALLFYAGKLLVPEPLMFVYPRWEIDPQAVGSYWPVGAVAVLAVLVFWLTVRAHRSIGVAAACYVVTLFPALGFFNVVFMRFSYVADHFAYLATIGPIALCVGGIGTWMIRRGTLALRTSQAAAAILLLTYGALTARHAGLFGDLERLWRDTLAKNPDAWLAHNNLGVLRMHAGRFEEAERHFQRMLATRPANAEALVRAHTNLASLRIRQRQFPQAAEHAREALRLQPVNAEARNNLGVALAEQGQFEAAVEHYRRALTEQDSASTRNNLGNALLHLGRHDEAVEQFLAALTLDPNLAEAHHNLGLTLAELGRHQEAVRRYRTALERRPDYPEAHFNLARSLVALDRTAEAVVAYRSALGGESELVNAGIGLAALLAQLGRYAEAAAELRAGLQRAPSSVALVNNLAWLLATCPDAALRDGAEAVRLAEQACRMTERKNVQALSTLSAALAETDRLDEAERVAREALALAETGGDPGQSARLRQMLEHYQAGRPYREGVGAKE